MKITEATSILESTDAEFIKSEAEALAEVRQVESVLARHQEAITCFRTTGKRILDAVDGRAWVASLDATLFPNQVATNSATADEHRKNFFAFQNRRLASDVREQFVKAHVDRLCAAFTAIIADRSKGRTKWREKVTDQWLGLQRKVELDTASTSEEEREIERLQTQLETSDFTFQEAKRAVERLGEAPSLEFFNDARRLAYQFDYES